LPGAIRAGVEGRLVDVDLRAGRGALEGLEPQMLPILDPVAESRTVRPGASGAADAAAAVAAIDAAVDLVQEGVADALVTLPVSKESIATHHLTDFRGHTEYLAAKAGLTHYGRDYLMVFLAPQLQVALLTTHAPLRRVIDNLSSSQILEALELLSARVGGRLAVAGLNPHAGEGGLMGSEEESVIRPAVREAQAREIAVSGPESPDSLFARARRGEFDWVLALYHDQGLIAVKTASFGTATNWTLGLPFLRTSVDHGTAFGIAGQGVADEGPLAMVIETTLALIDGRLPITSK
jgi:4-hydroxythreonine-4-phosphate dehydrogenase